MKKSLGYVYIMTNPCFRENCIKIGKTSSNPEKRKEQLSAPTGIPLPFELYAYVESEQYSEIESAIIEVLTLAGKRINPKREFFNLLPDDALKYLVTLGSIDKDLIINAPDEIPDNDGTIVLRKYHTKTDETFKFRYERNGSVIARLQIRDNKYIVLEGSKISPEITSNKERVEKLRKDYSSIIKDYILIDDAVFDTPSAAGQFVSGRASNGKTDWVSEKSGKSLNEFIIPDE